ncbi:MAG TPA: hypothetical protein VG842_03545 [Sediminibacterium sp.]|nr:hypothetical protein [Sediminibacterium sp.]
MEYYLLKYLALHKSLCLPQVGCFVVQETGACFDAGSGLVYPPSSTVVFQQGDVPKAEKRFFGFLAAEMGLEVVDAIKAFHQYAESFRERLRSQEEVSLTGIGRLYQEGEAIGFEEDNRVTPLSEPLQVAKGEHLIPALAETPEQMAAENTEAEPEKDIWWFYALLLAIAGIGALVYYYW